MRFSTFLSIALLATFLVATPTMAQSTSSLAVTGMFTPGGSVTISLTGGVPNGIAVLAVSDTLGSSFFDLGPFGSATLGLGDPVIPILAGFTDTNGDLPLVFNVSANLPPLPSFTLHLQSVTLGMIGTGGGGTGGGTMGGGGTGGGSMGGSSMGGGSTGGGTMGGGGMGGGGTTTPMYGLILSNVASMQVG